VKIPHGGIFYASQIRSAHPHRPDLTPRKNIRQYSGALSERTRNSLDLGFLVQGVLAVPLAVFHQFQLFLHRLTVLAGRVISSFALTAGEGYDFNGLLFRGHGVFLSSLGLRRIRSDSLPPPHGGN